MKLHINFSNAIRFICSLLLFALSLVIIQLTVDHDIFGKILTHITKGTLPEIISLAFITTNLLRVILFNSVAICLLKSSLKTKTFCLYALSIEALALLSNYIIIEVPIASLWSLVNTLPICILIYVFFFQSIKQHPKSDFSEVSKKTMNSISFKLPTSITKLKDDIYNPYRTIVNTTSSSHGFKNFILIVITLVSVTFIFLLFKDPILKEINFFLSNTTFLKDSGLDKIVEQIPVITAKGEQQINETFQKENLAPAIAEENSNRKEQIKNKFTTEVYTKRFSDKKVTHYELAHVYLTKKNFSMAVKEFNLALNDPQSKYTKMLTHYFLAKIYERNYKNSNLALKHWMILKEMPSHDVKYQTNLPKMAIKEVARLKVILEKSNRKN